MGIWDRLTPRTWEQVETVYPTWAAMEGKRWYTVMDGYLYALADIRDIHNTICFLGEPFTLMAKVTEDLEPEFGGDQLPTGDVFTGTATASFLGVEYPMTYDEASGLWQATLTGPDRAAWSETAYTFTVTLTAVNDTGETRATYDLTAYRALPSVQTVETPDSITGGTCTLRAHIVIETVPAGGDSPAFAGSAQADFMGTVYVTDNDDNEASLERTVTAIWLVPDRTEADLQSLMALHAAGWDNLTDAQRREWWYGAWREALHWTDGEIMECLDGPLYVLEGFNRGAYNIEDVNRVETAVSYLVERLRSLSAFLAAETKEDWAEEDIPLSSQLARYLANIVSVAGGYDAVLESASISMRPSPSRCRPCRRAWRT